MRIRGSYHSGFAPRDFEPAYPSLWKGCIGAWCPSLGPTGTILRDWSGRQLHGTLTNATMSTVWANSGEYSLLLDGSDDLASIAHTSALNVTTSLTMSAWVNTTDSSHEYVFAKHDDSFFLAKGVLTSGRAGVNLAGTTPGTWLESTVNIDDGLWHHLCATYDSATFRLYVDGLLNNSRAETGSVSTGTAALQLGSRSSLYNWTGRLDDLRLYNRSLHPAEISLLYSGGRGRGIAYSCNRTTPLFYTAPDAGGSSGGTFPGLAWRNLKKWRFVVRAGVDGNWPRVTQ